MKQKELFSEDFKSKEEYWFFLYLCELKENGFIKRFEYEPLTIQLTDDVIDFVYIDDGKSRKLQNYKILSGVKYTADYRIVWNKNADGIFYWRSGGVYVKGGIVFSKKNMNNFIPFRANRDNSGDIVSIVDTKGTFSGENGMSGFVVKQKALYAIKKVFVQKIPVSLCEKGIFFRSFFPRRIVSSEVYKRDCKFGKEGQSKIKVKIRLIEHFVSGKDNQSRIF